MSEPPIKLDSKGTRVVVQTVTGQFAAISPRADSCRRRLLNGERYEELALEYPGLNVPLLARAFLPSQDEWSAPAPRIRDVSSWVWLAVGVWAAVCTVNLAWLFSTPHYLVQVLPLTIDLTNFSAVFTLLLLTMIVTLGHEAAHAGVATLFGVDSKIHAKLRPRPRLVTNIPNAWCLPRSGRVQVALAGPALTASAAILCLNITATMPLPRATQQVLGSLAGLCLVSLVINLLPAGQTDGYFALMHALGIANLDAKSSAALRAVVSRSPRVAVNPWLVLHGLLGAVSRNQMLVFAALVMLLLGGQLPTWTRAALWACLLLLASHRLRRWVSPSPGRQ